MPSLITKWKKGRPYLYWVRSAWVDGRSRIVEQIYLGPKDRVMENIRVQFTPFTKKDDIPQLKIIRVREFGASTLFYWLAQKLELIDLINLCVPQAPPGRRTSLTAGHYLILSAINRAIYPQSKQSLAEWYRSTVLNSLLPASVKELSSQRFWDHMDLIKEEHLASIQQKVLAQISEHFPLEKEFLLYDTTNYYTFIHTFNSRPSLPQRGKNKQKRTDLRQLSLVLVVDEKRGIPLYYRCYDGNTTDVVALRPNLEAMIRHFLPHESPVRLTLVLDKGNISGDNLKAIKKAHFSFIAAIPRSWVRHIFDVSLKEYQPLSLPSGKRIKVYTESPKTLLGCEGKLLIMFSPSFYRKQIRTLDLLQQKAEQKMLKLQASINKAAERKSYRKENTVKAEINKVAQHDQLKDFFSFMLCLDKGKVHALRWQFNGVKKCQIKHNLFGKTVLFTDRQELTDERMVVTYRSQSKVEEIFRISKTRRPGLWWPAYHWTDSKLSVHALSCFLAMLMIRIVLLRLKEKNISLEVDTLIERLRNIHEAIVVYANGTSQHVIAERSPEQEELFSALDLGGVAKQLGNRIL